MQYHMRLIAVVVISVLLSAMALTIGRAGGQAPARQSAAASGNFDPSLSWFIQTVDASPHGTAGQYASLAIEPGTGYATVAYQVTSLTSNTVRIAYAGPIKFPCALNPAWNCFPTRYFTATSLPDEGDYTSLAFDPVSGLPGVAYRDLQNSSLNLHSQAFCVYDGWPPLGCADNIKSVDLGATGFHNSLKYTVPITAHENVTPHIAYQQVWPTQVLRHAKWVFQGGNCSFGAYECDTIDSNISTAANVSLELDPLNRPRIAYKSLYNDLMLASYVGSGGNCGQEAAAGTWQCDVIDFNANPGSIALHIGTCTIICPDSTQIAYYSSGSQLLKYAKYVGTGGGGCTNTAWRCVAIEQIGIDNEMAVSLAVDIGGSPIIAYHVKNAAYPQGVLKIAYPATVLLASPSASASGCLVAWTCVVVDDGFTGSKTGTFDNVGQFASLALNSGGLAYIAYFDETTAELRVAYQRFRNHLPLVTR